MSDHSTAAHPVDVLAVEFVDQLRRGKCPAIGDYVARHPELAGEIEALFPTIECLERARGESESTLGDQGASLGPARLQRLGDLRIIREIGRGGMGIVYEAEQESLGRRVAVKVLPRQSLLDEKQIRRFEREARTAANLHHTNIVPILGVGESDGFRYYVMQYIRGVSLDQILPLVAGEVTSPARADDTARVEFAPGSAGSLARALMQEAWDDCIPDPTHVGVDADSSGDPWNASADVRPFSETAPTLALDRQSLQPHESASPPDPVATAGAIERLGPVYWANVARIGLQVASALEYAHQHGTLHRDIKPANIIIDPQGTAWVADFGLAKAMEHDDVSGTGDVVGTLKYMAPEQVRGSSDSRSDLYSLGLTLYELLTLRSAYDDSSRRELLIGNEQATLPQRPCAVIPAIPRDLETIVLKSIAVEPEYRYRSAHAMALDLERFLDGRPIEARRVMPWERLWRWGRRNPALAITSAAAAVLLCVAAVISTVGYLQVSKANIQASDALVKANDQREIAEANASLALATLDSIFQRFAPSGLPIAFEENGVDPQSGAPAILSNEAADLLEELVVFYKELREQHGSDPAYRERIALANRRLGDIDQRLGRYDQAEEAYNRSLDIYTELGSDSTDPDFARALAGLHIEIGSTNRNRRRLEEAGGAFKAAEQLLAPIVARDPLSPAAFELARVWYHQIQRNSLAPVRGRSNSQRLEGDRTEADRKLQAAIETLYDLADRRSGDPAVDYLLGLLYLEAASFYQRENPTAAVDYHDEAIAIFDRLDESHEDEPEFGFALCRALAEGNPRQRDLTNQQLDAFAERLIQARVRAEKLVESHPQVPDYKTLLAGLQHKLGTTLMRLGFSTEAHGSYGAAIEIYETLADKNPQEADFYALKGAFARQSLAGLLLERTDSHEFELARDELLVAIRTIESTTSNPSDRRTVEERLKRCYALLAEAHERLKEPEKAAEALERSR